jgi:hypothetical protein
MKLRQQLFVAFAWMIATASSHAAVTPASLFADHMVLQRGAANPVWGWAAPGEMVTVEIGKQVRTAKADPSGAWRVTLAALPEGQPLTMTIAGSSKVTISDILVGEVWLCSGQSNMNFKVSSANDATAEIAAANHPLIREFKVQQGITAATPQDRVGGAWAVCSPDTAGGFSATAYYFARSLHQDLDVPIGIITSAIGGTDVLAWTSYAAQDEVATLRPTLRAFEKTLDAYDADAVAAKHRTALADWEKAVAKAKANKAKRLPRKPAAPVSPSDDKNSPARLFNAMIHPLVGYGIRGAIWYQGERNSKTIAEGSLYFDRLSTLVYDWRNRWNIGDFPFIAVQLPDFHAPQKDAVETTGWVMVREGVLRVSQEVPNGGMAVGLGLGNPTDIHPKNKQDIGKRLALWALAKTYDRDIAFAGPTYVSQKASGAKLTLKFDHVSEGFMAKGDAITGFAIAGADQVFHTATAEVRGDSLVLTSPDVAKPVAARYAWADNPNANLHNAAGLPAPPFRTDGWDVTQEGP